VREQVHGQLDAELVDIGEQHVKNIARPIRVYRVGIDRSAVGSTRESIARPRTQSRRMNWVFGVTVIAVVMGGALLIAKPWNPSPVSSAAPALSLAILPFAASSNAPAEGQFAAALTEDLTTAFGQWRWARVAAPGLMAGYKGKVVDARTLGQQLQVRYVVEGDVRNQATEYLVTTHLIDVATGAQAWSDTLRFAIPAPQQPVPHLQMAQRLRNAVLAAEVQRATREKSASEPMDLVLRGRGVLGSGRDITKALPEARALFDNALLMRPDFVPALYGLLQTYDTELEEFRSPDRATILAKADGLSSRMIGVDRNDYAVWRARAIVLQWLGRFDEAMVADERAQLLAPWSTAVVLDRAWILIQTGRSTEAVPLILQAIDMDPLEQSWPYHFMCKARLFLGQYADAVAACEKAATENDWWLNQLYLCAAYAQRGDSAKAVTSKNALLAQQPGYTIDRYRRTYAASPPAFFEQVERHLAAGLRKAGLPER
jgi:TolB-like protein/Flp pilus assembly protein TadD